MLRDMKFFLRPSDDVCCIAVSSDNHTCVTSTDVNNHATLGIVCGAQVPKCEPARVASRRNVWGTRCERSDVSCETLCRCACALVDCVSKCVTKKQWQQAMRTRPWCLDQQAPITRASMRVRHRSDGCLHARVFGGWVMRAKLTSCCSTGGHGFSPLVTRLYCIILCVAV